MNYSDATIGIVGLGYVGLPLSIRMGSKFKVIGYDINKARVIQLNKNIDITNEFAIIFSMYLFFT